MDSPIKVLPNDQQAERSVLGSMLLEPSAIGVAEESLVSDDFYNPKHQEIFKAIVSLSSRGQSVDILLVKDELEKRDQFENIGGIDYLIDLTEDVGLISNIQSYCKIVLQKSTLRRLIKVSDQIMASAYKADADSQELMEIAEKAVFEITQETHTEGLTPIKDSLIETIDIIQARADAGEGITGVTTGLTDLDKHLSGLQNSDLVLLAARPSMGKTALGLNIAISAALKGNVVAMFSLEMSKTQLVQRIIAFMSLVDLGQIISGQIKDWEGVSKAVSVIEKLPFYIDDTPSISLSEFRAKVRRLKMEEGLNLIVVDYLQLMTTNTKAESRQVEISEISRGLKAIAKEMNCPILALAQLSRAPELRTNKRPILSDLRESGAIEQDADVVMMLYRDDYYNEDSEKPNTAEVIIEKHRNGPTGTVDLFFHKELTKFGDLARGPNGDF